MPPDRLARLDTDGWELESAEARHAAAPDTFWIPPAADRHNARPGQAAKLLFRLGGPDATGVERMWVYITARDGDRYRGRLQNQPDAEVDLRPGTVVWFAAEHIADLDTPPPDYRPR